ncbi:MAG: alanine racemase, partial [Phycisphaerae bacterium]|nr:alanine racemase [Phycisphaerae bacterium]
MRPTRAEISLDAIRYNLAALGEMAGPEVKILAMVKANAYGHGAAAVARCLVDAGAAMLGVAFPEEGAELRAAGLGVPILVFGGVPVDQLPFALENDLTLAISEAATAEAINRLGGKLGCPISVHLKVDTGMSRMGVRDDEAAELMRRVRAMEHVRVEGVCSHFSSADEEDLSVSREQICRFGRLLQTLAGDGARFDYVHLANSAAIMYLPESCSARLLDEAGCEGATILARPGISLYGLYSSGRGAEKIDLKPALALKSAVVLKKILRKGEGVSYGLTWRAERDSVIGVVPVGYGDGYSRSLSNKGQVRVGEGLAPVVGRVCMDATMIDLTGLPDVEVGTEVTLIEARHDSPISAEAIARLTGTISHEVLTRITSR